MTSPDPSPRPPGARRALALLTLAAALGIALLAWRLLVEREATEPAGGPASLSAPVAEDALPLSPPAPTPSGPQSLAVDAAELAATPAGSVAPGSALTVWTGGTSGFTGHVVDHQNRPLAGASVICWPNRPTRDALGIRYDCLGSEIDSGLRTTTDEAGRFTLRAPAVPVERQGLGEEEDFAWLLVEAEGFAARSHLCSGLLEGDYDAGTIALEPGGSLIGRVVDERGQPVAGARLHARQLRCAPRLVATTDLWLDANIDPVVSDISGGDGRFELGGFWPGTATVTITALQHLRVARDAEPIEIGVRRDLGDIVLSSGGSLTGVVVDKAGAPVAGAAVFALKPQFLGFADRGPDSTLSTIEQLRKDQPQPVKTDGEGRFTLPGLELANLQLFVDATGFEPLCVPDLTPGPSDLRVELGRPATLQLTVLDRQDQTPIATASVEAERHTGHPFHEAPRLAVEPGDGLGRFVVERIGTLRTDLVVTAPGYASAAITVPGARPPETVELSVALEFELRVGGRVLGLEDHPLQGVSVQAQKRQRHAPMKEAWLPPCRATTRKDGRFELRGLSEGEWTLVATIDGFARAESLLVLTAGVGPDDVDFRLERLGAILGVFLDGDGNPATGSPFFMTRRSPGHESHTVYPKATGEYLAANLGAGRWEIYNARLHEEVDLAPGQWLRVDLQEPKPALVRGQVSANGRPLSGALVMALGKNEKPHLANHWRHGPTVKSDDDGRYELKIDAGEWLVLAGLVDPPAGASNAVTLMLEWGDQHVVDLVFGGECVRVVVVEAGTARPLEGVALTLARSSESDPFVPSFWFGDGTRFWPLTDGEGRAELPFVLPGKYSLTCQADGYLASIQLLTVTAGQPQELRFELSGELYLSGVAKLGTGVPVKDGTFVSLRRTDAEEFVHAMTEAGVFEFDGLGAGDFMLALWPKSPPSQGKPSRDRPLVELPVTLRPGEPKTVDLIVPN